MGDGGGEYGGRLRARGRRETGREGGGGLRGTGRWETEEGSTEVG